MVFLGLWWSPDSLWRTSRGQTEMAIPMNVWDCQVGLREYTVFMFFFVCLCGALWRFCYILEGFYRFPTFRGLDGCLEVGDHIANLKDSALHFVLRDYNGDMCLIEPPFPNHHQSAWLDRRVWTRCRPALSEIHLKDKDASWCKIRCC